VLRGDEIVGQVVRRDGRLFAVLAESGEIIPLRDQT
jgi:hypothetical protein